MAGEPRHPALSLTLQRHLLLASALASLSWTTAAVAQAQPAPAAAAQPATTPAPAAPVAAAAPAVEDPKVRAAALVDEAKALASAKSWKKAAPLAAEAVKLDPSNAQAHALAGLSLYNLKKYASALPALEKALAGGVTGAGLARAAADCAERRKDKGRTVKWLLVAAKEEKDQALALKAAKTAEAPAAIASAYDVAAALGKLQPADLLAHAAAAEAAGKLAHAGSLWDQAAAANPGDANAPVAAARVRVATKDWAGADERLEKLRAARPDDAAILLLSAEVAAGKGDAAGERKLLEALLVKQPKYAPALRRLAKLSIDGGDNAAAQKFAEAALAADPKDQGSHDVLGRVLYAAGQKEAARPHLELACAPAAREKGKPAPAEAASADALVALADLELTAGKRDAAKPLVARAKAAGAKRAAVVQARLLAKDGDLSGAERTLAGYLAQNTSDGDALAAGADIAYERGQYPQARERFEKALGLLPKGALTPVAQGRLCDVRVRDAAYAEAKEACEGALKGGADTVSVHASYGLALYRSGDKKAGKAELDAAAKKGAKDPAVHGALGAIAAEEGREAEVLSEYDQVLAQEPNNAEANAATGRVLAKRGQHKDASARLSKAFKANPDDALLGAELAKAQLGAGQLAAAQKTMGQIPQDALPPAVFHGLRGRVENKLGNYKRADEEYAKAQEKSPEDAELLKLRGQNFLKMPNYDRAIPALEKARSLDPQNLEVAQELTRLYSETGQTEKVAKALGAVEALEKAQVAARKQELKPGDVRRISFQDNLAAKGGADGALAPALSERVTADLSQSAYVELVDLRDQMAVERQREAIDRDGKLSQEEKDKAIAALPQTAADRERDRIINSQLSQEEKLKAIEGLKGKEKVAQWALAGDYRIEGDTLFVNLKAQRLVNPVTKSSLESGPKASYAQVEKRAVIGLLKNLEIPLAPDEEAALGRTEGLPNLDSAVLTQQADDLVKKGDVDSLRKATELYKRARDADQGNAQALVGLDKSLAEIAEKNRLMVLEPRPIGEVPESLQDMVKLTLQSKLSGVRGVRVVEGLKKSQSGEELPENDSVAKELDRLAKEPDSFDPSSYDIAKIGQVLGANVLVKTEVMKNGDDLVLNARLHEIKDGKLLVTYGTQRAGKMADQQKLQADLAKDIAQYLRGEPSDEEKASLAAVKDKDDYKKQMDELAKLRAEEKARKEALALKAAQPKAADARVAAEAEKPPEAKKPAVIQLGPVSVPESGDDRTYNVFMASGRLSSLSYNGDKSASLGVLLSHTAKRWGHHRLSVLLDFESTRVLAGRSLDASTSRAAFYGAGADYTVPLAFGGTGLFLGAEAMLGLSQGQRGTSAIATGYALTVAPHAGLALAYKGIGLTADLGYRFAFGGGDGVGLGGFFLQAGIRKETASNEPSRHGAFELGYTAHLFVPNSAGLANYQTLGFVGGGATLQHTVTLLSQGGMLRNGAWISYGSANGSIAGTKMTRAEASWAFILNAFDTEDLFNPYVGLRIGLLAAKAGADGEAFNYGLLGAPMAGLDLQLFKGFVVGIGASYDASTGSSSHFDGYAIDASATLRF